MLMALTLPPILAQSVPRFDPLLGIVFLILFIGCLLGWLVASLLGFARAREFGSSTRWFALASVCLLVYHLHLVAVALLGRSETDVDKVLSFGAFFPLFGLLGSICAIIGFMRLTNPRP